MSYIYLTQLILIEATGLIEATVFLSEPISQNIINRLLVTKYFLLLNRMYKPFEIQSSLSKANCLVASYAYLTQLDAYSQLCIFFVTYEWAQ